MRSVLPARRRLLVAALAVTACTSQFTPASLVTGLQVLAVKAEPPDLRPGGTAALSILVIDPALPTQGLTTVFVGCDPDPTGLTESACARYQDLEDASQLLAFGDDGGLASVPGARLLGFNDQAAYTPPANLFDALAADDLNRQRGVLADILSLTVAEVVPIPPTTEQLQSLLARVQSKQTASALALKEIRVTQTDVLNQNPVLSMVYTPDRVLGPNLGLNLLPGAAVTLGAATPIGANETYLSIGPDGTSETRTESPIYSWFATAGAMSSDRSTVGSPTQFFTAPLGGKVPADRSCASWVVVRDERGGVDWGAYPGFVCDASRAAPSVTSSTFDDLNHPERITLSGQNLDQIVDSSIEGVPALGRYDATAGTWTVELPIGPSGPLTLELADTACQVVTAAIVHP